MKVECTTFFLNLYNYILLGYIRYIYIYTLQCISGLYSSLRLLKKLQMPHAQQIYLEDPHVGPWRTPPGTITTITLW